MALRILILLRLSQYLWHLEYLFYLDYLLNTEATYDTYFDFVLFCWLNTLRILLLLIVHIFIRIT
jgi:hypothetical protein